MQPDAPSLECSHGGCGLRARWRPFVYAPVLRVIPEEERGALTWPAPVHERGLVVLPLPIVVCNMHKLPHRVEETLKRSRRFRRLLAAGVAARGPEWEVQIDRAWVVHERIEDDRPPSRA